MTQLLELVDNIKKDIEKLRYLCEEKKIDIHTDWDIMHFALNGKIRQIIIDKIEKNK